METLIGKTFLTLLFLSSVFSIVSSSSGPAPSSNIDWWCNLTPHPVPCKHYINTQMKSHHFQIKHKTIFWEMLLQYALNQALITQKEAHDSDQNSMSTKNHRTVHGDCLKHRKSNLASIARLIGGNFKESC